LSACLARDDQEREAALVNKLKSRLEPWFGPGGQEGFVRGVQGEADRLVQYHFATEMMQTIG